MEGYMKRRAELYDAQVSSREKDDVEFYVQHAKQAGSPVLELGCGTGRVLLPMAISGLDLVGVEVSSDMLKISRDKASKLDKDAIGRIELLEGDM